jgi:hypothetical protein
MNCDTEQRKLDMIKDKRRALSYLLGSVYITFFLILLIPGFRSISFTLGEITAIFINLGMCIAVPISTLYFVGTIIAYRKVEKANLKVISDMALFLILISFVFIAFILGKML